MKNFLADIFPKIQRFSADLDNQTLLTNQHWVLIDNLNNAKTVYIFRGNGELLVSTNGKVEKSKWESLGHKSLLIDQPGSSYLFRHGFFDDTILALKVDSSEEYAIFVNETKYGGELNSLEKVLGFLGTKYLRPEIAREIEQIANQSKAAQPSEKPKILTPEEIQIEQRELKAMKAFQRAVNLVIIIALVGVLLFITMVLLH